MAFNPFRAFRKYQKVLFAGLTILCMITFVLAGTSSLGGDFFSWLQHGIGGRLQRTDVAELYGSAVTEQDIVLARIRREIANKYMFLAVNNVFVKVRDGRRAKQEELQKQFGQLGASLQQEFQAVDLFDFRLPEPTFLVAQRQKLKAAIDGLLPLLGQQKRAPEQNL